MKFIINSQENVQTGSSVRNINTGISTIFIDQISTNLASTFSTFDHVV